jgi:lipoyl(octanoyl) transferase
VDLVRGLADCIAAAFAEFGVATSYDTDHPGVWTEDETPSRKLASVGMRVRRGTSTHGAAVNLVNDMEPFRMIVPCGMPDAPMARLAEYVDASEREAIEPESFREHLYDDVESLIGATLEPVDVDLPDRNDWAEPTDL